jgi:uncharacterized protein (TIGR02270 family)
MAPDHVLEDVAGLEGRLVAHVDALVLAGAKAANRLLVPALGQCDEPGRVECGALALLLQEEQPEVGVRTVLQAFLEGNDGSRDGIRQALRCAGGTELERRLRSLLDSALPSAVLAAVLDVLAAWRVDPGPRLSALLAHEVPEVRAGAFRCASLFPAHMSEAALSLGLRSAFPQVIGAALDAGVTAGHRLAWLECRRQVAERGPLRGLAMQALAIAGGEQNQRLLLAALGDPPERTEALRAVDLLGTVDAARACLPLMREKRWAPLAAEAFSMVTGRVMEPEPAAQDREPADADLEARAPEDEADEALPRPDVSAVETWWAQQAKRFDSTTRYVHGQPFGQVALLDALRDGSMYRRRSLARVLALRTRGEVTLSPDAWTRVQRAQLDAARRLPASRFSRSLEGGVP